MTRVHLVDPSAFTPPYDRALGSALARAGADVELWTSRFGYGEVPPAPGVTVREAFYRWAPGRPGSRARQAAKLVQHVPDMLRYARAARRADVVHFQWLTVQPLDVHLLPRTHPLVLTAHDVLPREPRPGQLKAQRRLYERVDAVVVHSEHGRGRLVGELGLPEGKVHVIPHGPFTHLADVEGTLPPELGDPGDRPVVLFFGLIRPYKGLDTLAAALTPALPDAELWVVGLPRMPLPALPPGAKVVPRFVSEAEAAAVFRRATVVVLPYREIDQSGVLYTALGLDKAVVLTDVGGFPEIAAPHVPPDDPPLLRLAIEAALANPAATPEIPGWDEIAARHLDLYGALR